MYSLVKVLRTQGRRRHDREILSATPAEGDLTLTICGGFPELKLCAPNALPATPLIPSLLEARVITMLGNKMLFRGIEREPSGAEHIQEWSVQIGNT